MIDLVALARTLHGHCGLLAAVALLHPAITLRGTARLRPGTRWSVVLATALVTLTAAGGWLLYPGYRAGHKQELLRDAFPIAQLFESKEHLAYYAVVLAWTGCVLVWAAPEGGARRLARFAFGASAGLTLVVGVLGSVVASAG